MENQENTHFEKDWRVWLAGIIFAAFVLRAAGLAGKIFFIDEAFSYMLASHGFHGILRGAMSESNPPLPMFLFHFWQMFGKSEVFLRVLPVILNLLTIPVVFALGRRMRGISAGLIAAALFAAATGMVDISLIYRYPAQLTLLSGLFILLYFRAAYAKTVFPIVSMVLLVIVETAGLYTHYFFIFPALGVNLTVLWDVAVSRTIKIRQYAGWLAGQFVVAAAFAPWALAFRHQATKELGWIPPGTSLSHLAHSLFGAIPKVLIGFLVGPIADSSPVLIVACVGLIIMILLIAFIFDRENEVHKFRLASIFAIVLLVPYFMMIFLGLRLTTLYFCIAAPMFFAILGAGAFAIGSGKDKKTHSFIILLIVVPLLTSIIYNLEFRHKHTDNKAAIQLIESGWREGDVVVINPTYQASLFEYYAPGRLRLFGVPKDFDILKYNFNDIQQITEARMDELDGRLGKSGRVWAFMGFGTKTKPDQKELTIRYLREHYKLVKETPFEPVSYAGPVGRLYLFEKR
jgi:mannosyltransferase